MRKKRKVPGNQLVRMSANERMIVQYIVQQLEAAYRNSSGKPVYAKNMDQVMKDIFGVKKFTKTLEKARYNEGLMIQLMKKLDTETLWQITRSKEHYRLLCELVALDNQIVKDEKRYSKMENVEPAERPTRKMRKLAKTIKASKKTYKQVVKTFRNIFDIERVDVGGTNSILDSLDEWLERHDDEDDIFYGLGYDSFDSDAIESMDAYVRRAGKGKRKKAMPAREGALDIFSHRGFDDEDDDGDIFEDLDDDEGEDFEERVANRILKKLGALQQTEDEDEEYDDGEEDEPSGVDPSIMAILNTIKGGFNQLSGQMADLADSLTDDYEDEEVPIAGQENPPRTINDFMALNEKLQNGGAAEVPVEVAQPDDRPVAADPEA
jgi:hypothetical protein